MYPHERSLAKRLEGKPFAILGINSDTDLEKLKKVLIDQKITWRSWFDGGRIGGPIAKRWNIHSWPRLYVVDHTGTIRHKYVGPPEDYKEFDVLLDKLVQDAERGAAGTGSK